MKRFLGLVSMLVAVAVAALCVGPAIGSTSKSTNFTATYKGTVHESVNGDAVTATPSGTGKATLIGKGTLSGTVSATTANPPCTPLNGPGTLKGAKGTLKLTLSTGSKACAASQDDQNNISFVGTAKVTGGTGVVKKSKGSTLTYRGHYDRGTGAFNVKLTGTLKY